MHTESVYKSSDWTDIAVSEQFASQSQYKNEMFTLGFLHW